MAGIMRIIFLAAALLTATGLAVSPILPGPLGAAFAQQATEAPDYDEWERVASRAEEALINRRASNAALESLRSELVKWRAIFQEAQTANAARIATLKMQIEALGPPPAEGEVEPPEIATRRAELSEQLLKLEAPAKAAVEAYNRADGLIKETAELIRQRNTERLLVLGPSPLNPTLWQPAWKDLSVSLTGAASEVSSAWAMETTKKTLWENMPATLAYLAVALVALLRGGRWMERLTRRIQSDKGTMHRHFWSLIVSTGQVLLPVAGFYALSQAAYSSGLLGLRGQNIVDALPMVGLAIFGTRWLGRRLFPKSGHGLALMRAHGAGAAGRRNLSALGWLWAISYLQSEIARFERFDEATVAVLNFPLLVLSGLFLFRIGQFLRTSGAMADDAEARVPEVRRRAMSVVGLLVQVAAVVGPVLAGIGYYAAAVAIIHPTAMSLGLLALLIVLSAIVKYGYALLTGRDEAAAGEALLPVVLNLFLFFGAIPFFALIWGASTSDLAEYWTAFLAGFRIGDTRISPVNFIAFAVVFSIGYALTRMLQGALRGSILPKTRIEPGGRTAIVSGLGYVGFFLSALIAISAAGIDLSSLAIVVGALSVGIGFGLQNIVQNFVSGVILLIERPIAEGDWIEVGGTMGYVRQISVRSTRIETFDRTDVFIPNGDLVAGTVTNYTRGNTIGRAIVPVGVAYGTDTHKVEDLLRQIANEHPDIAREPPPSVHFVGFGADSLNFEIRAILRDVNRVLTVKTELNHQIARRFEEEGIAIPFPQRDIWLRNPEALRPAVPPAKDSEE